MRNRTEYIADDNNDDGRGLPLAHQYRHYADWTKGNWALTQGMVGLAPKCVRLAPKWDKSGAFSDQISVHLAPPMMLHRSHSLQQKN